DGRSHLGSLLAVDARIDAQLVAELREHIAEVLEDTDAMTPANQPEHVPPSARFGITLVEGPGLAVRVLGTSTQQTAAALHAAVNQLRARWRDHGPIQLRKYSVPGPLSCQDHQNCQAHQDQQTFRTEMLMCPGGHI